MWKLSWTTKRGTPVSQGAYTVTPESQALEVRWPGGGFVWNHPAAVIIEHDTERGGEIERAPIRDETRAAQIAAWTVSLLALLAAAWTWKWTRTATQKATRKESDE